MEKTSGRVLIEMPVNFSLRIRLITIVIANGFFQLACTRTNNVEYTKEVSSQFLTGTWDRQTKEKPALVNVFTDSGLMQTFRAGKIIETLWFRLDSSKKENVIIFSQARITKTLRPVLDTSAEVFGMLMRTKGKDTLLLQIPILTFTKRIPTDWDEELPSNAYVLIRRKYQSAITNKSLKIKQCRNVMPYWNCQYVTVIRQQAMPPPGPAILRR